MPNRDPLNPRENLARMCEESGDIAGAAELRHDPMPTPPPRAGDIVKHHPSGEIWTVAAVSPDEGWLSPAGWPQTIARVSECTMIKRASDKDSTDMTVRCRELPGSDIRRVWSSSTKIAPCLDDDREDDDLFDGDDQ